MLCLVGVGLLPPLLLSAAGRLRCSCLILLLPRLLLGRWLAWFRRCCWRRRCWRWMVAQVRGPLLKLLALLRAAVVATAAAAVRRGCWRGRLGQLR